MARVRAVLEVEGEGDGGIIGGDGGGGLREDWAPVVSILRLKHPDRKSVV